MTASTNAAPVHAADAISRSMTFFLAAACGLIVANLYYAQPLVGPISVALGMSPGSAGLIVTLTQIGYGLGLLLVVPLGDLFENRRLIVSMVGLVVLALLAAGLASTSTLFLLAALFIGLGSVAVQIIVPLSAHMAPEAMRGQVVGNVVSGLMVGIMMARPVASFIAQYSNWHTVFFLSAAVMVVLAVVLARVLPQRVPAGKTSYGALLASMGHLALNTPVLRRRALYQACLFSAFSLFWTTTPLLLGGPTFGLSQNGIALFALAGVAGAIAAPIAGRLADRGLSKPATAGAIVAVALAFIITHIGAEGSTLSLVLLTVAAILLDFGVSMNLVLGQRAIYALGADLRSRLNGLFMATFFIGGAIGSALGGWIFAHGGWPATAWAGLALPVLAFAYFLTEGRKVR